LILPLVRQLNFIKNAYANLIQFPTQLTAAASATAATSPILTDFVVMRTGDPTADVFVHGLPSTAPGLSDRPEIRMGTTKFHLGFCRRIGRIRCNSG
jgi:hypothetical protein